MSSIQPLQQLPSEESVPLDNESSNGRYQDPIPINTGDTDTYPHDDDPPDSLADEDTNARSDLNNEEHLDNVGSPHKDPVSSNSSNFPQFSTPSFTTRAKGKGQPLLSTTTAHGVYRSNSNSRSVRRIPTVNSMNVTANDNESIYSEIASSFSNNFLFNFARRENPLKSGGLGKEYWLQDSSAAKCFLCDKNFTTFRRKHHCRICGQIFCSNCTLFIPGEKFNFNGKMRVCKSCLSYADKYDDTASSDESVLEDNLGEVVYPTRSNDTGTSSIQTSIRAGNYLDQDVVVQAPTPPPRMAIPATRHGASVEIPSRNLGQRTNSLRVRRPRISQSSHHLRSGMIPKNQHQHQHLNSESTASAVPDMNNSHSTNLRFLQQIAPTGFSGAPNMFNFGQQPVSNSNGSALIQDSKYVKNFSPSSKNASQNTGFDLFGYPDDESEDEQSMSLYKALHDDNRNSFDPESSFQGKFSRNFSSEPRRSDSNTRLTRNNVQSRSERAQASLWRMKNRRRAKTTTKLSFGSQLPPLVGGLHRANTINFEDDTFTRMANNSKRNLFDFSETSEDNLESSAVGTAGQITSAVENKRVFSLPNKDLKVFMESHASQLLRQSLADEALDDISNWEITLFEILKQVGNIIPDVRAGESFDIRQYIKLKRIPGASINNCSFVDGVVFSKNVALKSMAQELVNPQICLVMFPIEYTKSEQHFMSLELVLAQEKESLHKLVGRIIALRPDILFVGDSISGLALDMLNEAGIVVVYNMKPQVIERISKMTDADVVTSIDKLAVNPKLGTCDLFEVKHYVYEGMKRSYIFLTGCDTSNGGTVLLRGGTQQVLKKVKNTVEFLVYVFFNLNLEYSLFRDEYLTVVDLDIKNRRDIDNFKSSYYSEFIEKLRTRYLSSSSVIKFYMPPLLYKAREADDKLTKAIEDLSALSDSKNLPDDSEDAVKDEQREAITLKKQNENQIESIINLTHNSFPNVSEDGNFKIAKYVLEKQIESLKISLHSWQRQWELFYGHSPYLLEPTSHQSLLFLYTMVNSKTTVPCIGPETLGIDYYWISDISLGQYIEHISLTANGECPEGCGNNLLDHYRSYVHGNGKVDVIVEPFQSRIPGLQNLILMWNYCKDCRQSTPVIPMSETTWKYSFGKFLELSFWSENIKLIGTCPHDFKNHIRYFGIYNLAVRMEYSKVETLELVVPKFKLHWKPEIDIKLKIESFELVRSKSIAFFDSISERLNRVKVDSMTIDKMEAGQKRIEELKNRAALEKQKVFKMMTDIYNTTEVTEHLPLNSVIRNIQELSVEWDVEFQEFEIDFLPSEKDITRITASQLRKLFMDKESNDEHKETELSNLMNDADIEEKLSEKLDEVGGEVKHEESDRSNKMSLGPNVSDKISKMEAMLGEGTGIERSDLRPDLSPIRPKFHSSKIPIRSLSEMPPKVERSNSLSNINPKLPRLGTNELELELRKDNHNAERISSNGKVKQLTSLFDQLHFDQISMEFEMQRERERRKLIANRYRAIPVIASKPIVEVYKNVRDAVEEELSDDESTVKTGKKKAFDDGTKEERLDEKKEDKGEVELKTADKELKRQNGIPQTERASLMKTLTSFWADRSAALWKPLAYPLSSTEHIFVDSDVIVREDEPSSLIAFCLSSSDYGSKLKTMRENPSMNNPVNDSSSIQKGSVLGVDNSTTAESQIEKSSELERIMLKKTAIHLKYQFQEGSSLLSCKIFFAEQFDAFRQECGIDANFLQSLSRCIKWDSTGGKSGSAFLKTLDDRFIIKELSHTELDAFVKFAPSYFEYLAQALFHDLPTVLAKIFGFYQIHIRNPIDNKNVKMDLLIMENLFYDRKTSRIFDLKGSMRNRHVEQTGKENEVLLDENMVEYIYESPLFVKEYAKKLLRTSLWNDTLFLSRMNVMDYSLVIGIDSENHELVVGIIDCIRTFTWDKKLESWVKEKGLVGGGGKEPTVVTPRQYKNRFRDAMDRYILMVPDCWNQGPIE